MNAYESVFEQMLKKRLREINEAKIAELVFGASTTDFSSYRERVGYLRALNDFEIIMKEVSDDLNKEEK